MSKELTPQLFAQLYMESWHAGHTTRQFADRIGMTAAKVRGRIYFYRKRGWQAPALKLPPRGFHARRARLPVSEMNVIVDESMLRRRDHVASRNGELTQVG
jgi:hypothetical protein